MKSMFTEAEFTLKQLLVIFLDTKIAFIHQLLPVNLGFFHGHSGRMLGETCVFHSPLNHVVVARWSYLTRSSPLDRTGKI